MAGALEAVDELDKAIALDKVGHRGARRGGGGGG